MLFLHFLKVQTQFSSKKPTLSNKSESLKKEELIKAENTQEIDNGNQYLHQKIPNPLSIYKKIQ